MEKRKNVFAISIAVISLLIVSLTAFYLSGSGKDSEIIDIEDVGMKNAEGVVVKVYKSVGCGCCGGYISALEGAGFSVEVETVANIDKIKDDYNIPQNMRSCHTAIIGDYFVEGHVPVEAIYKLLNENPEVDGIALPGMPSGAPGMPGMKKEKFSVYAIKQGKEFVFAEI